LPLNQIRKCRFFKDALVKLFVPGKKERINVMKVHDRNFGFRTIPGFPKEQMEQYIITKQLLQFASKTMKVIEALFGKYQMLHLVKNSMYLDLRKTKAAHFIIL